MKWARQEANTLAVSTEKRGISAGRAAKCAVSGANTSFVHGIAMIMRLPLSDDEKADAVRRLLAGE
jgi:hypothetical protein